MRVQFEAFEVDLDTGELSRAGRRVRLADKPFRILEALLEHPGQMVSRDTLRERLWPDATFVNFDNNLNTAVNKLREALSDSADAPRFIETVPKRGYRFIGDARGLAPETPRSRRFLVSAVAGALIAVLLVWLAPRHDAPSRERTRLVVLPFENLTGAPSRDYLTDGMTEELIGTLARIDPDELGVIARTSSMRYKGVARDVSEIAHELSVDYLLEGSVRRQGDRFRVHAQLIAASNRTHVWSDVYESGDLDLFAVQREVSEQIARTLSVTLTPRPAIAVAPPELYETYLKARYLASQSNLAKSIERYETILELDDGFAPAWIGLADAVHRLPVPPPKRFPRAAEAARRALELEPASAEAHLWLAVSRYYYDWDWTGAGEHFERALELAPGSAEVHHEYASYLASMGRHDDALAAIGRAKKLDPVSVAVSADFGWYYYVARRYEDAIAACREAIELEPRHENAWTYLVLSHFGNGNRELALEAAQHLREEPFADLDAYWRFRIDSLQAEREADRYVSPLALARYHLALDEMTPARELLQLAFDEHAGTLVFLNVYPLLDGLRDDASFQEIVTAVGIPEPPPVNAAGT